MSLADAPFMIREDLWVQLGEIVSRPSQNISSAIQKLGDAQEADIVVQIPNDATEECKKRIATSENQGENAIRPSVACVDERDRGNNQTRWCNFCKAVCGDT